MLKSIFLAPFAVYYYPKSDGKFHYRLEHPRTPRRGRTGFLTIRRTELARVLVDLLAFVRGDMQEHMQEQLASHFW